MMRIEAPAEEFVSFAIQQHKVLVARPNRLVLLIDLCEFLQLDRHFGNVVLKLPVQALNFRVEWENIFASVEYSVGIY